MVKQVLTTDPILWHSFSNIGQALVIARLDENDYGETRRAVVGILFLATPHRGSRATQYPDVLANVVNLALAGTSGVTGRLRTELLAILSKDSEVLLKLATDFRNQISNIKVVSFIEQSTTPPFKIRVSDPLRLNHGAALTNENRLLTIIAES